MLKLILSIIGDPVADPTSNAALKKWLIEHPDQDLMNYPHLP